MGVTNRRQMIVIRVIGIATFAGLMTLIMSTMPASAAVITFDDLIAGETSYGFDGDGDGIDDVIFSTTDPAGFNTVGPGAQQSFIDEPGLEGTTLLSPDLRVDFLFGAVDSLEFGFAMSLQVGSVDGVTFSVFDASDMMLASRTVLADFTSPDGVNQSSFPEGLLSVDFESIASYATFDFSNNQAQRYIIDNFAGTFGSTQDIAPVPEPSSIVLLGLGLAGFGIVFLRRRKLVWPDTVG